jgi:general secretion pathway protein C
VHAIRTGPEAEAAAILSVGGGEQKRIAIGEEAAPGLTLKAVQTTSVLIAAGGRDIEIPLFSGSGDRPPPQPVNGNAPLRLSQDGDGFTIFTAPTSGRLASIGLRPGDTVRAINGEDLIRERLDEQLGLLSEPGGATVTIERDGRTETLVIGEGQ